MTHYRDRLEAGDFSPEEKGPDVGSMTKDELIGEASRRGIDVSDSWSKAAIREAIEKAD